MKKYSILVTEDDNGSVKMTRENDGFNAFEILGFVSLTLSEITNQIEGNHNVDEIHRIVNISKNRKNA